MLSSTYDQHVYTDPTGYVIFNMYTVDLGGRNRSTTWDEHQGKMNYRRQQTCCANLVYLNKQKYKLSFYMILNDVLCQEKCNNFQMQKRLQ